MSAPSHNLSDLLPEVVFQGQSIGGWLVRIAAGTACLCYRGERRQQILVVENISASQVEL